MSKPIEHIVRPFQTGEVFTRSRLAPISLNPTVVPPDDEHTIWKGEVDSSYRDDGSPWYTEAKSDLKEDKSQRESKLVKVQNPDDPDQKLYVERIDKSVFKDSFGKETSLKFDWSAPKDSAT